MATKPKEIFKKLNNIDSFIYFLSRKTKGLFVYADENFANNEIYEKIKKRYKITQKTKKIGTHLL